MKTRALSLRENNNVLQIATSPKFYSKENLLATFAPQRDLTPEQIFWSKDVNEIKRAETSVPKPLSALTVYPPNTSVKLVPMVLPTESQVKINLYTLTQLFTEFDKTCKKRITPTGLTEGERGKKFTLGKLNCGYQWRPALGKLCPFVIMDSRLFQNNNDVNRLKLKNFVEKFIRTVRFGNDHFGAITGYGDYVIGDSVISRVYYVEGLGHNLFFVGQICDSDLEIAFRKHSCFVRDMNGVDLLKGSRSTNLYTIPIDDMMKSSLVCLLSKSRPRLQDQIMAVASSFKNH
ncbi:hypothetical protein Tco_1174588 [Tanacetum coccineum]